MSYNHEWLKFSLFIFLQIIKKKLIILILHDLLFKISLVTINLIFELKNNCYGFSSKLIDCFMKNKNLF